MLTEGMVGPEVVDRGRDPARIAVPDGVPAFGVPARGVPGPSEDCRNDDVWPGIFPESEGLILRFLFGSGIALAEDSRCRCCKFWREGAGVAGAELRGWLEAAMACEMRVGAGCTIFGADWW